eukprot:12910075-Ditylum_brightwellii.AAC.1
MAYEDIEHKDSLTLDVKGDQGVEVHEGIEMEDYHDEEETLEENTMDKTRMTKKKLMLLEKPKI